MYAIRSYYVGTPVNLLEVYDGDAYRALIQDRVDNHGLTDYALTKLGDANTDWQSEIYRNAFSHDQNFSFGGTVNDVLPYRLSLGLTDQNGLLKNSNMNRKTVDLSLNPALFDNAP